MLFFDDLLVLELKQLSFAFEVGNDLAKTLLQEINLCLEKLDLLVLFELLSRVFFDSLALRVKLHLVLFILLLYLRVFVLKVGKLFILDCCFVFKALVLFLNIKLDSGDVFFGSFLCILLIVFK